MLVVLDSETAWRITMKRSYAPLLSNPRSRRSRYCVVCAMGREGQGAKAQQLTTKIVDFHYFNHLFTTCKVTLYQLIASFRPRTRVVLVFFCGDSFSGFPGLHLSFVTQVGGRGRRWCLPSRLAVSQVADACFSQSVVSGFPGRIFNRNGLELFSANNAVYNVRL